MTDKEYKAQKRRIRKVLKEWVGPCGFGWYRLVFEYDRHYAADNDRTFAMMTVLWQYRSARIVFFLPVAVEVDEEELEHCVVHELCHLLVGSIEDYSSEACRQQTEYAVTAVTNALLWARKAGREDAKCS